MPWFFLREGGVDDFGGADSVEKEARGTAEDLSINGAHGERKTRVCALRGAVPCVRTTCLGRPEGRGAARSMVWPTDQDRSLALATATTRSWSVATQPHGLL